jgi:4-hydroxy-3-methylbut-2-enyl diphosphate reductase
MAEIRLAKTAGFCFGVSRAVQKVYEEAAKASGPVYTYGPVIHNEEVVRDLEEKGVKVLHSEEELLDLQEGTVIIRSHGVGKRIYDICAGKDRVRLVDATCPFVGKIHEIIRKESAEGRKILIIGDASHPEVQGIRGWSMENTDIAASWEDVLKLGISSGDKLSVVAQTTYNSKKFVEVIDKLKKLVYDIRCFNTICNATQERQTEARNIASEADAMIVIGGKSSSNTRKLVEICREECGNVFFIQTADDLKPLTLTSFDRIGITAGASTPQIIIEEVQNIVRSEF